jgi:circadian clock protein KaiB
MSPPEAPAKHEGGNDASDDSSDGTDRWELCLYVAGMTPPSVRALENIRATCTQYLDGRYTIEVIDLLEKPHLAARHQILAVPTLVRCLPPPVRQILGDLSSTEHLLVGLGLRPKGE